MALGDGSTWDETEPTLNSLVLDIAAYDVDVRAGVRSRMALEHEWPAVQSQTNAAGYHKYITFQTQSSNPAVTGVGVGSGTGTQVAALFIDTNYNLNFLNNQAGTTSLVGAIYKYGTVVNTSTQVSGVKICMGQVILGSANYTVSGLPFHDATSYNVFLNFQGAINAPVNVGSQSVGSFTIYSGTNGTVNWLAIGI